MGLELNYTQFSFLAFWLLIYLRSLEGRPADLMLQVESTDQ